MLSEGASSEVEMENGTATSTEEDVDVTGGAGVIVGTFHTCFTAMAMGKYAVCAPPAPVEPRSFTETVTYAVPSKLARAWKTRPRNAVLMLVRVPLKEMQHTRDADREIRVNESVLVSEVLRLRTPVLVDSITVRST